MWLRLSVIARFHLDSHSLNHLKLKKINMKRRDFFKHTAPLVTAPILLNSGVARAFNSFDLFTSLSCDTVRERFLVVVQLRGANDGLNTIIRPEYYNSTIDHYWDKRPDVYIPETDLLTSSNSVFNEIKFHPSMGKIRDLANKDCLNVIQSVGYPTMNRSHFKATDLWLTGGDGTNTSISSRGGESSSAISEGWMGLYLENIFEGYSGTPNAFMPDPLGIHLKSKSQSLGFHTHEQHLAAVNLGTKKDGFYTLLSEQGISSEFFEESSCGDKVDYIKLIDHETQVYGKRIREVHDKGQNSSVNYGSHDLGTQLKTVARLVNGGSKTKIFLTEMNGFDTHVQQLAGHANLMIELSESVHAFMDDLDKMGILDRCLIVTFSEFGRKFTSNISLGTDHGTLAPMLVFGHPDKINSGLTGPKLNVTTLDTQGAPNVATGNHVDYRNVFRSILNKWLGAGQSTLDLAFSAYTDGQTLDLIKTSSDASGTLGCYVPNQQDNEHIVNVSIPTVEDEVIGGTYAPAVITPGGVSTEPLHEITACNYVDLLPGFVAKCGTNVIVYPFACNTGTPPAPFKVEGVSNQDETAVEAIYTKQKKVDNESQLLEVMPDFERIKIKLFPNPTTDLINVTFKVRPDEKDVRLELLDANGSIVPVRVPAFSSQGLEINVQLNISHVPAGVYYVRYVSRAMTESFKIIKM